VFYRQHKPASRQEKAVAVSIHFKRMFASRPMEADLHPFQTFKPSIVLVLPSPFRCQRSKIEIDEDEHESERAKTQRPLVNIPKNFC
jgi:hypothetical protein